MAKKTTTAKSIDKEVAQELEKALDLDLNLDVGDLGDLDIAASMEDLEAQIAEAADELARASQSAQTQQVQAPPKAQAPVSQPSPTRSLHSRQALLPQTMIARKTTSLSCTA
jgi:hypothetical protein